MELIEKLKVLLFELEHCDSKEREVLIHRKIQDLYTLIRLELSEEEPLFI